MQLLRLFGNAQVRKQSSCGTFACDNVALLCSISRSTGTVSYCFSLCRVAYFCASGGVFCCLRTCAHCVACRPPALQMVAQCIPRISTLRAWSTCFLGADPYRIFSCGACFSVAYNRTAISRSIFASVSFPLAIPVSIPQYSVLKLQAVPLVKPCTSVPATSSQLFLRGRYRNK